MDAGVEVVDVGSGFEVAAGVEIPRAVGVLCVVLADEGWGPVETVVGRAAFEDGPYASAVFLLGGSVVDHDVGDALDVVVVEGFDEGLELGLGPVLGCVEVVESSRHVPWGKIGDHIRECSTASMSLSPRSCSSRRSKFVTSEMDSESYRSFIFR